VIKSQLSTLWNNKKLKKNAILATTSTLISFLISLGSAPIIARLLSREDYGMLSYLNSLQGMVLAFSSPGIANAISYSVTRRYEGVFRAGTYYRLRIYLRNSLVLVILSAWYLLVEKKPLLALLVLLSGLLLPWTYAFDTSEEFLMGRWDFSSIFWRRIGGKFFVVLVSVTVAYFIPSSLAVFTGRGIATTIFTIALFYILLKSIQNDQIDPDFWTKGKDFSKISVLSAIGNLTDRLVLGKSGALSQLASYSVALSVASPLDALSKSFIKVIFGKMGRKRSHAERKIWFMLSFIVGVAGIPILLICWNMVLPLALKLFPKYPELSHFVPYLLISASLSFGANLGQTYSLFNSYERWNKYNLIRNAFKIPTAVGAVLIYGVYGALYVRIGYSLADFIGYNFLLLHEGPTKTIVDPG
jgi:O-antigen/teichoic acid export membrane protein